jgi:hypothetical protein
MSNRKKKRKKKVMMRLLEKEWAFGTEFPARKVKVQVC